MSDGFPDYIARAEEDLIRQEAARVGADRRSRAVLLYGPGGVGKTRLVRRLAHERRPDDPAIWLEPIDVDDSQYWLLSNLEQRVVEQIDPAGTHFGRYHEYLSQFPHYPGPSIDQELLVSHLGRIKKVFVDCYRSFVEATGRPVVVTLDTVEVIRGMDLLLTLTQWMKSLPGTLFVLSGRPLTSADSIDPIRRELEDPHQSIELTTVELGEFGPAAALGYLDASAVAAALSADEKTKLIHLTRGHPLWLALTVDYLLVKGIPEEAAQPLADIQEMLPAQGEPTTAGRALEDAYKRRLVTPYRETDFWHEAIKRLAVVRKSVNLSAWQELMADCALPPDAPTWPEAWEQLLRTPWIRPRANERYATLHDALADELTRRLLPLHDQDQQWRRSLWKRAVDIYARLTDGPERELRRQVAALDGEAARSAGDDEAGRRMAQDFIATVGRLSAEKRELDQLKAAGLYFQLLSDFEPGARQFLAYFENARREHDLLFENLIAVEMQRFLPATARLVTTGEAEGEVMEDFHRWLGTEPGLHIDIGLSIAAHLIENEQPDRAASLLEGLPITPAQPVPAYRRSILIGNAVMRIPGRVREGKQHFDAALETARALVTDDREKLVAEAHKEMGYYLRNEGLWELADQAYQEAHSALSQGMSRRSPAEDREEMASIQTNWAYVKGLRGNYREGLSLVDSAIAVRRRLELRQGEATSWSVRGELLRFNQQFEQAWTAYQTAQRIFEGIRDWPWLGLVYQEQAICLLQAAQAGVALLPDRDAQSAAEERITYALDICHEWNTRGYPSALNRAGRIFGRVEPDRGLDFLSKGIEEALRFSDGWFWLANLIEYVELCYRVWAMTGEREYRDRITARAADIATAVDDYDFPDLHGRWRLVQGHLGLRDALGTADPNPPDEILAHYARGFLDVAEGYAASHGAAAVNAEFRTFAELFTKLPDDRQEAWEERLRSAWQSSTPLMACLEQLY
ncbi:AAA family ATPase [Asanoa sp. NPDC049573]|uniref:AAA family ATPase n=1 Tax=Asanoa sp. NPDC049573 TaxID=3155396 RepID=UPI00342A950D